MPPVPEAIFSDIRDRPSSHATFRADVAFRDGGRHPLVHARLRLWGNNGYCAGKSPWRPYRGSAAYQANCHARYQHERNRTFAPCRLPEGRGPARDNSTMEPPTLRLGASEDQPSLQPHADLTETQSTGTVARADMRSGRAEIYSGAGLNSAQQARGRTESTMDREGRNTAIAHRRAKSAKNFRSTFFLKMLILNGNLTHTPLSGICAPNNQTGDSPMNRSLAPCPTQRSNQLEADIAD